MLGGCYRKGITNGNYLVKQQKVFSVTLVLVVSVERVGKCTSLVGPFSSSLKQVICNEILELCIMQIS